MPSQQMRVALLAGCLLACLCPGAAMSEGGRWYRPANKRSFYQLQCRGVFDKAVFGELESVCQECFTVYREPELHGLCRSECFTTAYFAGCLQGLMRADELHKFQEHIKRISGRK